MGSLFLSALLVIAAAGSMDFDGGLFVTKRGAEETISLPITDESTQISGNIFVASRPMCISPKIGPLDERAWVFQEWHLARRIVFFMEGGLIWRCQRYSLDERRCQVGTWFGFEEESWLDDLQEYAMKKLTYASDRLVALRGIVNEMKAGRDDDFRFGVWTNQLEEHLLWRTCGATASSEDFPLLPSWSWASLGGNKLFEFTEGHLTLSSPYMPISIEILPSGTLEIFGQSLVIKAEYEKLPECCTDTMTNIEQEYSSYIEREWEPGYFSMQDSVAHDRTMLIKGASCVLGLASFDRITPANVLHCIVLASRDRDWTPSPGRNTMQTLRDLGWNGGSGGESANASETSGHHGEVEKSGLNMSSIMDKALYNMRDQDSLNPPKDATPGWNSAGT
ncbi:hypothetical protein Daus18300_008211 [Diaporthe australafricana]|uniref:Heterokaryon incompatibility domain-containing protein n=1 Tax=Diaporthe australafricana TaxID=127596 RepID=A0ABR3WK32_9PEZI